MWNVSSDYWNWQAIWNLEFCFLSHSQFIMLPWAEYLFLWAGMLLPSFAACCCLHLLPQSQEAERLYSLGTRVCTGAQTCAQNQELRTHLWHGDRCDLMTYAGLFKLRSTGDTARRMESDVFHGMKFSMGLSKTLGLGKCLWSSKVVPILFRKHKKEKKSKKILVT